MLFRCDGSSDEVKVVGVKKETEEDRRGWEVFEKAEKSRE